MAPLATLYDGSSANLTKFLDDVKYCATACGWDNNLLVISNQQRPPENFHLITSH